MKPLVLLFTFAFAPISPAQEEHRLDAFAKTITPFFSILAKERQTEARAFSLKVRIEQATDLPAELKGAEAEITLQAPDRLRLRGPLFDEVYTLVRDGEKVWISPGSKARALLDNAIEGKSLPPPEKDFELGDFKLPFPEKQLAFLATLFSVTDKGYQAVGGVECRVVDVTLMPELAKSIESDGWVARLWIRPDHTPARLTVARAGWNIVLRIDDVKFAKKMPEELWAKPSGEGADVLELKQKEYSRFLKAIGGNKKK